MQADPSQDVEHDFRSSLLRRAELYGFSPVKQENWVAYHCRSSDREIDAIMSRCGIQSKHRALDLGCGFGSNSRSLIRCFDEVHGIELLEERAQWAKRRVPSAVIVTGNAINMPYPDEYFDFIIAPDVFEHVPFREQRILVKECYRVLQPGGSAYITVPSRFQFWDSHNAMWFGTWMPTVIRKRMVPWFSSGQSWFEPVYERTGFGWSSLFRSAGFQVTLTGPKRWYPPFLWRLLPAEWFEIQLTK